MARRIRNLGFALTCVLLSAGPVLAMVDGAAVDGALENGGGPTVPEPSAALLFAAGAGLVAWTVRTRRR